MTEIALIDSRADMNCIQEGLIPLKYNKKLSKRLIQANEENLIINKIPNAHICHDEVYFETALVLIKDLPSKIILGTPFMALLYPFLVTDKGIKTNVTGKDIFFRFILPPVLKEKYSSKTITILKDINEREIYRIETNLSSLKTEILLVDQMTKIKLNKTKRQRHVLILLLLFCISTNIKSNLLVQKNLVQEA